MPRKLCSILPVIVLSACATMDVDPSNVSAYCTSENAFRLGSQSRAYFGVCPKETENAFLAGLQRGRALRPNTPQAYPYYEQMDRLEKELRAAPSGAERERLMARLRDAEIWAIHIVNDPGSYSTK
jgi:uncharacterized protein DUF2799